MRILVTGASGFVGSILAPRLLAAGHELRTLTRDPSRVDGTLADAPGVEVIQGDILTGAGLPQALDDIEVAYYLIHSMESASAGTGTARSFAERDRLGARTFAAAAARSGVRRVVYLGGPLPREAASASPHLSSRAEVEDILREHVPDSVALRASIVIGARSRSFRMLVRLVERMPVLALPSWRGFRTQPIDARDVVELLAAAADAPTIGGRSLDIGGPEVLTYGAIVQRIADALLLRRPTLRVNLSMTQLTARLVAALTGEQPELTVALMASLRSDLLPADDTVAELLGVELHTFDAAVEHALREWESVEPLAAR
jgi:uncharacterized protein YbjT (DUF2867 family)